METTSLILLVIILPETFSVFRKIFGLTDELTLLRHVVINLYCWVLTPFLFGRIHEIVTVTIMFVFTVLLTYLFLLISNGRKEKSMFITVVDFFWKKTILLYKSIIMYMIILIGEDKTSWITRRMIRSIFADKKSLMYGTLFIFEPFLLIVYHRSINYEQKKPINKKTWFLMATSSLLASVLWGIFIYFSGIRI